MQKAGFTPNVPYTVSGKPEISLKFVKNDGVIVLAMEQVMTYFDMPGCVVVPLEEEYLSTTGLVQLKSRETSSITRKFMSFVKEWQKPISEKAGTEKRKIKNFFKGSPLFCEKKDEPFYFAWMLDFQSR